MNKIIINNYFVLFLIFSISLVYGFIVGEGYYGYSNDFYAEYYRNNIFYPGIREFGSFLATLTIFNKHIGVYLTSFFLALSSGFFLNSIFFLKKDNSLIFFLICFFILLHIHPIIMSTSGAMRQGWSMSFMFLALSSSVYKKNFLLFLFFFISIFLHKSAIFFFNIFFFTFLIQKLKHNLFFNLTFGASIFFFFTIFFYFHSWVPGGHRIIYGDFRFAWFLINIVTIILYLHAGYYISTLKCNKFLFNFIFFYSFAAIPFYFLELNYQYERINMVMAIPIILTISLIFNKKSFRIFLITILTLYLFLTIFQGMYSIGLK